MQHLRSEFPQAPVYNGQGERFHGNVKRKGNGERVYPEAERDRRAALWYAKHPTERIGTCGDSWPPIYIGIDTHRRNFYLLRRLSMN